jgi:hypothetical protein
LMSYFRNVSKVVSGHLFATKNNFVLPACNRVVHLETANEAKIEYVHSAKALVSTIK